MKDLYLHVQLELNGDSIGREHDPTRWIIEKSREEADAMCARHGARLRTDREPQITVTHGQNRVTGEQCLLVATRWAVVAPENAPIRPATR